MLEFPQTDNAKIWHFVGGFFVPTSSIHETGMVDAMSHTKSMAYFVVYYLAEEFDIIRALIFLFPKLLFTAVSFFANLLERSP